MGVFVRMCVGVLRVLRRGAVGPPGPALLLVSSGSAPPIRPEDVYEHNLRPTTFWWVHCNTHSFNLSTVVASPHLIGPAVGPWRRRCLRSSRRTGAVLFVRSQAQSLDCTKQLRGDPERTPQRTALITSEPFVMRGGQLHLFLQTSARGCLAKWFCPHVLLNPPGSPGSHSTAASRGTTVGNNAGRVKKEGGMPGILQARWTAPSTQRRRLGQTRSTRSPQWDLWITITGSRHPPRARPCRPRCLKQRNPARRTSPPTTCTRGDFP
jgi:hypothetical protein